MNSTLYDTTLSDTRPAAFDQAGVATYLTHDAAETAVRRLSEGGVPVNLVSIIGRHYQTREDVEGFYQYGKGHHIYGQDAYDGQGYEYGSAYIHHPHL